MFDLISLKDVYVALIFVNIIPFIILISIAVKLDYISKHIDKLLD